MYSILINPKALSYVNGGQGTEAARAEIDTIADLPVIADALRVRGYPEESITDSMGGNWQYMLRKRLPSKESPHD